MTVFTGCKDEDQEPHKKKSKPSKNFSAKIDGVLFEEDAVYSKNVGNNTYYEIFAFNTNHNGKDVSFSISFFGDTLGKYIFWDPNSAKCDAYYGEDATIDTGTFVAVSGSIKVTKIDSVNKTVSGIFNFLANDFQGHSRNITEGTFRDVPVM